MKKFDRPIYTQQLLDFKDKEAIKIVTGIRRCGKSSVLEVYSKLLIQSGVPDCNIFFMKFDTIVNRDKTYKDVYNEIIGVYKNIKGKLYVFLDEIQNVFQWELVVNSIKSEIDCDVYITGSNAYLLSSQLSTYLSGRYVEIKILPLSFKEFCEFRTFAPNITNQEKFELYIKFGGMPGLLEYEFEKEQAISGVLDGIFSTVIMEDIIKQAHVREPVLLDKIINYLADNIGNKTTVNNIKNYFSTSHNLDYKLKAINSITIDNYISLLQNAFVFYPAQRYDVKGKELLKTQGKFYIVDTGLKNQRLGFKDFNRGYTLENIVYFELLRRGYKVSIGKIGDKEIDFIATTSKDKKYIQVTETMIGEETRIRELAPLLEVKDHFEKIVLTADALFTDVHEKGIKIMNILDWLLKE